MEESKKDEECRIKTDRPVGLEERELRSLEERFALNHIGFRASLEAKAFFLLS